MKKICKIILLILGLIILLLFTFFLILIFTEYKPKDVEDVKVYSNTTKNLNIGDKISILTYNIGYLSLDKTQDFFLDGGKNVMPKTDENVKNNLNFVKNILKEQDNDIVLLQEVDYNSKRSYYMNQFEKLKDDFNGTASYAFYHKCLCIPYPIFDMVGKVESGMAIFSKFDGEVTRIALPNAYTFPKSVVMFKRCLVVKRINIQNTDKQLVVINLHLEAYDDGNTRIKQLEVLKNLIIDEYNKGNYVIAGGDFNQTFPVIDNEKYKILDTKNFVAPIISQDYLPDNFYYAVDDTYPTARLLNKPYSGNYEDTQLYVLDGYILSDNIELVDVNVIDTNFESTDHQPVNLEIILK